MTNSDLRQRAEAIARMEEQLTEQKLDIKAAYASAKSAGYSATALKRAIKVAGLSAEKRAQHDDDQLQFDLYLGEIEGKVSRIREAA